MNRNQKIALGCMFIMFCITATLSLYSQGALRNMDLFTGGLFACSYLIVGFFMRKNVMSNPDQKYKWFR